MIRGGIDSMIYRINLVTDQVISILDHIDAIAAGIVLANSGGVRGIRASDASADDTVA